ncbi:MAG: helix-turn-helix transcriptional regulator [Cyclobacteriaceae bacterium]|nr:helix-turn-helix transcriptional regulator [Cyclobacteriaceae bacterium]
MTNQKETVQSSFLNEVRNRLPQSISFADELSEVLSISRDSAYRRIRGETLLSLDEVKKLCDHFRLSLDQALSPSSEMVTFQVRSLNSGNFSFEKWLHSIYDNLQMISQFAEKELIYHAKDLPIFHYFQYPLLSAFKMYFWFQTFAQNTSGTQEKFHAGVIPQELLSLGNRIWDKYAAIPSTEILSQEALTATLRNIEFTLDCGLFQDRKDAVRLCDDCQRLLERLSYQAENARKGPDATSAKFDIYHNEILIGDNTILFKMGEKRVTFVTANNFDLLATSHPFFCHQTEQHIQNVIRRSTLLSLNAQKERAKFFNRVSGHVEETRAHVS